MPYHSLHLFVAALAIWCTLGAGVFAQQLPQEAEVASYMKVEPGQQRSALVYDPILAQVARARATDMAVRNYFGHVNPDGVAANYLVQQAGYVLPAWWGNAPTSNYIESIAAGQPTSAAVWSGWMASSGHKTHLLALDDFYKDQTRYGVGYFYSPTSTYKHYWVVLTAPPSAGPPPAPATTTGPVQGSTLAPGAATFIWNPGTGVSQYWLYGGSTQGGSDLFSTDTGSARSLSVGNLPQDGAKVWLRLWSLIGGQWYSTDSWVNAAPPSSGSLPAMTSPASGATLGAQATFQWSAGTGVTSYWLDVGSTPGGADLYSASTGTSRSATVAGLPVDGRWVYVRLWWLIGRKWTSTTEIYSAVDGRAVLTSPSSGSVLTATTATLSWSAGSGVSQYWVSGGTTQGGTDLFTLDAGTTRSRSVTGLPGSGEKIWLRLWSRMGSQWSYADSSVTAVTLPPPAMISPAPGTTLGQQVTFQWSAGSGITKYHLEVGTSAGGRDFYDAGTGTGLSATVSALPNDGRPLFVRLWWLRSGKWFSADYSYISRDVRAALTSPAEYTTLSGSSATFTWSAGEGVGEYWLSIGSYAGATNLYSATAGTALSTTVSNLPTDGRLLYIRLWSRVGTKWLYRDFTCFAATPSSSSTSGGVLNVGGSSITSDSISTLGGTGTLSGNGTLGGLSLAL